MTNKNRIRILASLVRISDDQTAADILKHASISTGDLGQGIACQKPGITPGVVIDATWIRTASDEDLDKVLGHELCHAAYGPGGDALRKAIGNFAYLRARVVPERAREDYNIATDAIMDSVIGVKGDKRSPMVTVPAEYLKDLITG